MRDEFSSLEVGHLIQRFKTLGEIAVPGLQVGNIHGGMAMKAGAGLLGSLLPLGEELIFEHERVSALLTKILRECIACPHHLQARICFEP